MKTIAMNTGCREGINKVPYHNVTHLKNIARIAKLPYLKSELEKMSFVQRKEGRKRERK